MKKIPKVLNLSLDERKKRAAIIVSELKKLNPNPQIELNHSNVLELLIAIILSAQSTDKKINEITPAVFKKYPTLDDYVNAKPEEFEVLVHSSGFYRAKTKNILAMTKMLKDKFNGKMPQTMEELLTLPGVARKSANVIMTVGFNNPVGIVVDTHVIRLAQKFGLTTHKDPVKIEKDLMEVIPKSEWKNFNLGFVLYGRHVSTARKVYDEDDPISVAIQKKA